MRSTFNQLYYINRSKEKTDGTTAVFCRITIDGKSAVIATGIYCKPDDFNSKKGEIRNAKQNGSLLNFRKRVGQIYEQMLLKQKAVSAELLKNKLVGINSIAHTLLQGGADELKRLEKRSVEIKSRSTYRQSIIFQECLKQYIFSLNKEDFSFLDITEQFGLNYKTFLLKDLNCSSNKMNKCFCWLNRLVYIAVDREIIRTNPMEDIPYEKKKAPKLRHITRGELKQLMETPMEDPKMELARRMFIFSSLSGFAYVDLRKLYPHHIGKKSDGRTYIRQCRGKTKIEAFVPLHPIAERILFLYNTQDETKPIFPLPIRDIMWHEIHAVGNALNFRDNLSHHLARHTFGTLLLSANIPIESIAKMMGHANISSTQIYAKITDDKISEDMDRLMKRRKYNFDK